MKIALPEGAAALMHAIEAAGHSAYLVGGCVRDSLRGLPPADYDLATSAQPEELMRILSGYRVLPTGIRHGTVTVLAAGMPYEVTTLRVDGAYSDHRRPDCVTFSRDITEDLARRDFTVNAMAYHPAKGLIDPFGGAHDLGRRLIRCVGDPHLRFEEDALRILRAARFAALLDFTIEAATQAAMADKVALLPTVSAERIFAELMRTLEGPGFGRIFMALPFLLAAIIPEMGDTVGFEQNTPYHAYTVYAHTLYAVDAAPPDPTVRLAMLLHDIAKPRCYTEDADGRGHFKGHGAMGAEMADGILRRLRCDNRLREDTCELIRYHGAEMRPEEGPVRRWLGRLGETQLRRLVAVKAADNAAKAPDVRAHRQGYAAAMTDMIDRVIAEQQAFKLGHLAVGGRDIIDLGLAPGPQIGSVLRALLDRVIEGTLPNERAALLDAAQKMLE